MARLRLSPLLLFLRFSETRLIVKCHFRLCTKLDPCVATTEVEFMQFEDQLIWAEGTQCQPLLS